MSGWVRSDTGLVHAVRDKCDVGCTPVAVIDPESAEDVERLRRLIWNEDGTVRKGLDRALREFAAPTPPRPDEPQGLGAVVEDADGHWWIKVDTAMRCDSWTEADCGMKSEPWVKYADIAVARVLSDGLS